MSSSSRAGIADIQCKKNNSCQYQWPSSADLDPAEEIKRLRARIAELERMQQQQTANSSPSLSATTSDSFHFVDTNGNDENREDADKRVQPQQEIEHKEQPQQLYQVEQIEVNLKKQCIVTPSAEEAEGHQQKENDGFCVQSQKKMEAFEAKLIAELGKQKSLLTDHIAELSDQFAQLVTAQGELWTRITNIEKGLITNQNHWDPCACDDTLTIIGPEYIVVVRKQNKTYGFSMNPVPGSVFAKWSIAKNDMPYYEVTIVNGFQDVQIGLATRDMPLDENIGKYKGTYSYSNGLFSGRQNAEVVAGQYYCPNCPNLGRLSKIMPPFVDGDTVGCGINLATRQLIFTLNGQLLDTSDLFVDSTVDLFPCVMLLNRHNKIEANFGPNFKFEAANEKKQ